MTADRDRLTSTMRSHPAVSSGSVAPTPKAAQSLPSIAETILGDRDTRISTKTPYVTIISAFLHLVVLGICGLIIFQSPTVIKDLFSTIVAPDTSIDVMGDQTLIVSGELANRSNSDSESPPLAFDSAASQIKSESVEIAVPGEIPQIHQGHHEAVEVAGLSDFKFEGLTKGRMSASSRKEMSHKYGGSPESEAAVTAGLKWLLNHQLANGSWSFQHSKHPHCKGQCPQDGGLANCANGATGMALLAFLGAGHTHRSGDYQRAVRQAVDFLLDSSKQSSLGRDFRGKVSSNEGMYVQGICAIALCECAAMTRDARVRTAADGALQFIVNAQNPTDGGWRYYPGSPGDTSVVGWQVMALKSGNSARIEIPAKAFQRAGHFLDSVQSHRGSEYSYLPGNRQSRSDSSPTMTAVGLLCRMYLGWDRSNPRLAAGVKYLDSVKPQLNNMYFNFYATQVMHHWGGDEWDRWNPAMRDQLVQTQRLGTNQHQYGSWDSSDPHGTSGGRLYMTCLSIMTLEIYYRYLPLFDNEGLKVEL